jgi:hypothetical protein
MLQTRLTAWLRPVITLLALAGALSLAGCGGGGGAPNNPYDEPDVPAVPPTLVVLPESASIYSGVPATLTITSGTAPFLAFSSNSAVLPLPAQVATTIPLLATAVANDETVTVTIRDATGQVSTSTITVRPALLLPASITITGNPVCAASGAQLCSGQDGTATVQVTGPAGAPLPGRSVRFDVVLGNYSLIGANSTTPAQSLTVQTDQNGNAAVTIRVPVSAATQFATLRATDVTTGSSVIAQFTIAQFVNGNTVLSVVPTGTTTFTGPDSTRCSSGAQANFYIFGGTPPYTVQTNFPQAVSLVGSPVLTSGGGFAIVTNGVCFENLTFAITDSAGRTLLTPPTASNVLGTTEPPAPPPGALALLPGGYDLSATGCVNRTVEFAVTGGTKPYSVILNPNTGWTVTGSPVAASGGTFTVSGAAGAATTTVTVIDGGSPAQTVSGQIKCS